MAVKGVVQPRGEGMENPKMVTGQIEVGAEVLEVLNTAKTPPFEIDGAEKTNEELRLNFRYIDLRRPYMQEKLRTRHRVTMVVQGLLQPIGLLGGGDAHVGQEHSGGGQGLPGTQPAGARVASTPSRSRRSCSSRC